METAEREQTRSDEGPPEVRAWRPAALARLVLVAAAAVAVLAGAPTALTAVLSLVALAVVAERLARLRDRSAADAVLVGFGGVLVSFILVGLVLGVTRIGLHPTTWAPALAVLALAGLVAVEVRGPAATRRRPDWLRVHSWFAVGWGAAIAAVVALAVTISVHATNQADVAPVQMSFGTISSSSVQVVVSSDQATTDLELQTEAPDGTSLTYPLFRVAAGASVTTSIVLPKQGRFVITLDNPDQSAPLRTLILNR